MYVAVRDCQLGEVDKQNRLGVLREIGVDAIEVNVDSNLGVPDFPVTGVGSLRQASGREAVRAAVKAHGLRIPALLMANDFAGDLESQVRWAVETAEAASDLSIPVVRVDLAPHSHMETEAFVTRAIVGMRQVIAESPASVRFAVENHGHVTNDKAVLVRLFAELDADRFGATMDTGNFYWYGLPLDEAYEILEWLAPRTFHTHLKNIHYPEARVNERRAMGWEYEKYVSPLAEGDISHAKVVGFLKASGYTGPLTIEDESLGKYPASEKLGILLNDADHVRGLL